MYKRQSISFGSPTVFNSNGRSIFCRSIYDSTNQKVVISYRDDGNSSYGTVIVGTVSGTSISFGTPVIFESSNIQRTSATFDSFTGKVVINYRNDGNSYHGKVIAGTVSGTSISFDTAVTYQASTISATSATFDSTNNKVVVFYRNDTNSDRGTAAVFSPSTISTNLTAENFIGISNGAYTNGQTATIQIAGAVDDAQSGLTPGQQYYVQGDGTLSETADSPSVLAGTAIAATKLAIG